MNPLTAQEKETLVAAARRAVDDAYAPYSQYSVGAALLTSAGEIVRGCNVENASYGLSNCAERTAIFAARAQSAVDPKKQPIRAIAIAASREPIPWPCGACRQVLFEFANDETVVLLAAKDEIKEIRLSDLLPHGFRFEGRT